MDLIGKLGAALEEEDVVLLTEAVQTALRLESGEGFSARSVVSMRDGSPKLDCAWMGMLAQITPDQARSMALGLLEEAAAAESDAAMVKFFRGTGLTDERIGQVIFTVREIRSQRAQVVGDKQEPAAKDASFENVAPFGSKPS